MSTCSWKRHSRPRRYHAIRQSLGCGQGETQQEGFLLLNRFLRVVHQIVPCQIVVEVFRSHAIEVRYELLQCGMKVVDVLDVVNALLGFSSFDLYTFKSTGLCVLLLCLAAVCAERGATFHLGAEDIVYVFGRAFAKV